MPPTLNFEKIWHIGFGLSIVCVCDCICASVQNKLSYGFEISYIDSSSKISGTIFLSEFFPFAELSSSESQMFSNWYQE